MNWEWIKEIAFGALNLSHDSLWKLTPLEFLELYEGWEWRRKQHWEEIKFLNDLRLREFSILASWVTAPHLKKPYKPTDFYDPEKIKQVEAIQEKSKKVETPEEKKKMLEDLESQMGVN